MRARPISELERINVLPILSIKLSESESMDMGTNVGVVWVWVWIWIWYGYTLLLYNVRSTGMC